MNYSKAIRVARSLADLSQGQLADRAEIDRSYLSLIESGKRQPSVETIEKIAVALKMPFHLLSLLGSEKADVKKATAEQIEGLALKLTELILEVSPDEPSARTKQTGARRTPAKELARPRIPAKRRSKSLARAS